MDEVAQSVAGVAGALGFVEAFIRLDLRPHITRVALTCRKASSVLLSSRISDHWKERAVFAYSLAILRETSIATAQLFAALTAFGAIAIAVALLFGLPAFDGAMFLDWPLNLAALIGGSVYAYLRTREDTAGDYGLGSQWLHRFALSPAVIREVSFDLDQSVGQASAPLNDTIAAGGGKHVFVSGLARAGTSILFRTLYATGEFETLTYRDMPFVLAPRLWRRLARLHGVEGAEQERAHKDGLLVSFDSPEAFEEVFWLTFAGENYMRDDRLVAHSADGELIARFRRYVAAVVASSGKGGARYLSKNNNNLLRLPALRAAFPDAVIVVPFRQPVDHAQSLWRQHQNFCAQQSADRFARQYMVWLGHFEFGLDHRPFIFGSAPAGSFGDPDTPQYWLENWIRVYDAVLASAEPATLFVDYDELCQAPTKVLSSLGERLGLPNLSQEFAGNFRSSKSHEATNSFNADRLARAKQIHLALQRRSQV